MEYVYASLLLHKAGKEITEQNIKKVLEAAGIKVDEARAKALVAALEGVNIAEAIEKASAAPVAQIPSQAVESKVEKIEEKKKEKEEDKKSEDAAAAGLGALFG